MSDSGFSSFRYDPVVKSFDRRISYGIANLAIGSNEDAYAIYPDHQKDGQDTLSSFGVFDGHNGKNSADYCAQKLHRMVIQTYNRLSQANEFINESKLTAYGNNSVEDSKDIGPTNWPDILTDDNRMDAMLCESFRSSCQYVDKRLRLTTQSGSTMSSLFLRFNEATGSTTAICANVGDSRAVMVTCDETYLASSENSITSFEKSIKMKASDHVKSESDTDSVISKAKEITNDSNHTVQTYESDESDNQRVVGLDILNISKHSSLPSDDLNSSTHSTISARRTSKITALSEDHTLALDRERIRVINNREIPFYPLPVNASTGAIATEKNNAASEFVSSLVKHITSVNPSDASFFDNAPFNEDVSNIDYQPSDEPEEKELFGKVTVKSSSKTTLGNGFEVRLVRKDSYVARRQGPEGQVGPEAVFGRYNVSVMMTRSLGDRFGPRRCHGVPDIRSVVVPYTKHARFVIASDGLWDVVTSDYIRCNALRARYQNPQVFASFLANKARRIRERKQLRKDDITVIVVDINGSAVSNTSPSAFQYVNSKSGTNVVIDGVEKAECMDSCYGAQCVVQ